MATERTPIHVSPESELSLVLRRAAESGRRVRVTAGDAEYELDVHSATATPTSAPAAEQVSRTVAGIRRAAGAWQDLVDADALTSEIYERRKMARRPSVEL